MVSAAPVEVSGATICMVLWAQFQVLRSDGVSKVLAAMGPQPPALLMPVSLLASKSKPRGVDWVGPGGDKCFPLGRGGLCGLKKAVVGTSLKKPSLDLMVLDNCHHVKTAPPF